jgi:hypothetical protein
MATLDENYSTRRCARALFKMMHGGAISNGLTYLGGD